MHTLKIKFLPKDEVWFTHNSRKLKGKIRKAEIRGWLDEQDTVLHVVYEVYCSQLSDYFHFTEIQIFATETELIEHLVNS